jgi:hypothetical protein
VDRPAFLCGKQHTRGGVQLTAAGDEDVDEIAGEPVETKDILCPTAVDVEVAVGTELEIRRWVFRGS